MIKYWQVLPSWAFGTSEMISTHVPKRPSQWEPSRSVTVAAGTLARLAPGIPVFAGTSFEFPEAFCCDGTPAWNRSVTFGGQKASWDFFKSIH